MLLDLALEDESHGGAVLVGGDLLALGREELVCNHKFGADFFGNANKLRSNSFLLLYAVVLKFYKKVIRTEKRLIKKSLLLCSVIVSVKQILQNFTGKTGRMSD